MNSKWIFIILIVSLYFGMTPSSTQADNRTLYSQLLVHVGKSFKGFQDSEYLTYDLILRDYLAKRINKRFGINLDPKTYSGFDLLEIEAFFKCKKSDEPFEIFLKMFPKRP
jgi:hypothetical protein